MSHSSDPRFVVLRAAMIDPYRTVWFELHEDILATAVRERSGVVA
ncbi:MAG TPA: hypothetical protein VMZ51_03940 [Acidimicrobiales bacterium]|nr:hypothetical protein [Acidimicrobiales bacterium]